MLSLPIWVVVGVMVGSVLGNITWQWLTKLYRWDVAFERSYFQSAFLVALMVVNFVWHW